MPRVSHLVRRNGIYWFKVDLPNDLAGHRLSGALPLILQDLESPSRRGHFKSAIWRSLRTTVEAEARRRVGFEYSRHANLFHLASTFIKHGHVPSLAGEDWDGQARPVTVSKLDNRGTVGPSLHTAQRVTQAARVSSDCTLSKALGSWSLGGGLKGAKKPAPNTVIEGKAACRRFIELFGDLALSLINKGHGRQYRDVIARIPKGLPRALRSLPVAQLLERDLTMYEMRSAITINKSLTLLGAVLTRAEQDGHFDGTGWHNPFDVAFQIDSDDEHYYEPFDTAELIGLLASPVFANKLRPRRGRGETAKWAPLLALFQGARRTEVIQLLVNDIAKDADTGVWTIRFDREGDKRIKTLSSIRRVPIHPQLITLGFLDFVEQRRAIVGHHASLWPGFEDRQKLASRANKWSEWFNGYLALHVVDDPVKKFHSFRGTFKRYGRAAGVDEVVINHVVGHSNNSVGARYGRKRDADGVRDTGYPLPRLVEEIGRIRFDGVQFGEPQGHTSRMA